MKFTLSVGRRLILYAALMLIVKSGLFAQDPHFSQFYANPVYTNPAFAGSSNHGRSVLNARNQWSSISGTFTTLSAAYDENYDVINGGLGFIVSRDEAGIGLLTTNTVSSAYSYIIPVNKYLTFRAAIQASFVQKTLDFGNFTWGDQILKNQGIVKDNTSQPIPNQSISFGNFAAGFIGYTKYIYGGAAVHNLTEPDQSFSNTRSAPISRRITAHAGAQIPLIDAGSKNKKDNLSISPNFLFMQQQIPQGTFNELNLGIYVNKGSYVLGSFFRQTSANSDAVILLIGLKREKLRIGYSFDATVSKAQRGAPSSHEVSIAFELRKKKPKKPIRAIRCPEF